MTKPSNETGKHVVVDRKATEADPVISAVNPRYFVIDPSGKCVDTFASKKAATDAAKMLDAQLVDVVPAPSHPIVSDAAANRRSARSAKSAAARASKPLSLDEANPRGDESLAVVEPVVEQPAKTTKRAPKTPAAKPVKSDPIADHIALTLADRKRGTFVSIREIAAALTPAYPTSDVRPPVTTISGRVRTSKLPEGWEPANGGERNVRGVIKR